MRVIDIIRSINGFVKAHTIISIVTVAAIVISAVAIPVAVHVVREKQEPAPEVSQSEPAIEEDKTSEQNKTEDPAEETPEIVEPSTDKKEDTKESEKEEKEPVKEEKKEDKNNKKEPSSSKPSKSENTNSDSGKDDNKDTDKNKPAPKKERTIVRTEEGERNGLKYIQTFYSDGTVESVVECQYCHQMPCPNGGGESCSHYDIKEDPAKTCDQCGRPCGDGYNGTCDGQIDWANGGKVICNHYD